GNGERVLTRLLREEADVRTTAVRKRLHSFAFAVAASAQSPGRVNQALMEVGSLLCRPRAPRCQECPLQKLCRAAWAGAQESLPQKSPVRRNLPTELLTAGFLIMPGNRVLLRYRCQEGLLSGLWEFPVVMGQGRDAT